MKIKINFLRLFSVFIIYFSSLISSDLIYEKLVSNYESSHLLISTGSVFSTTGSIMVLSLLTAPKTIFSEYTKKIKPENKKLIGKVTCSLAVIANSVLTVYGVTQYNVQYDKPMVAAMILGHAAALKGIYTLTVSAEQEMDTINTNNKNKDKVIPILPSSFMHAVVWVVGGFITYSSFGSNYFRFFNENFLRCQLAKLSKKQ